MEKSLEDTLFEAVSTGNHEFVSLSLSQGANPNKITSHGKTSLGEAANLGNIAMVKLLIDASISTGNGKATSSYNHRRRHFKSQKRKIRHENQHLQTVVKCKTSTDRIFKELTEREENLEQTEFVSNAFHIKDKNQGYFVFVHNEGSSSDEGRKSGVCSALSPCLTPSPQGDLEWDEDIGNVAPTTSEDETWSSLYKWYAAILECTGAAIASASYITHGIDQQDAFMRTALHYAAEQGHAAVVKLLLDAGCKVNVTANDGLSPLHVAVIKNNVEIGKMLILAGAQVNHKTHEKMTPLHFAASRGYLDMVQLLVNHGAYIESRDTNERTPLFLAAGRGHVEVVQYLISVGANVNGETIHGYTPLCEAVWQGYAEVVNILLMSNARVTHTQKLVHNAIIQREEGIVSLLAKGRIGLNLHNDNGDTPLLLAVRTSQPDVVRILLEHGANVNVCNNITWCNALHVAVESVDRPEIFEEILRYLLDYRIDMNSLALTGDSALNRALLLQKDFAAVFLIRYGANINASCDMYSFGLDNLSIASRRSSATLGTMLMKAGHSPMVLDTPAPRDAIARLLYQASRQPLSLIDLCRIKVRSIGNDKILYHYIASLPLPKSLKSFLMMEDEGAEALDVPPPGISIK